LEDIKVIVACGDELRQETICRNLGNEGFTLVSRVDDGYGLVQMATRMKPDVIILDSDLEGQESVRLVTIIRREAGASAFVMVSPESGKAIPLEDALRADISGYLLDSDLANLPQATRSAFLGGLYVSKSLKEKVLFYFSLYSKEEALLPDPRNAEKVFNATDLQILQAIVRGDLDTEIAKNLNLSSGYVRNCICRAKKKAGLKNRTQLSIYALSAGLITLKKGGEERRESPAGT